MEIVNGYIVASIVNTGSPIVNETVISNFVFDVQTSGDSETFTLPLESGGVYDFVISWGDGNSDTITAYDDAAITHTYALLGTHTIGIIGTIHGWRFNNIGDCAKIYDIKNWGQLRLGNSEGYFFGCSNMDISATDNLDLTGTTTLNRAFYNCASLTSIVASNWDISNVTNLFRAFSNCSSLASIDTSGWDISSITTLEEAFKDCSSLTSMAVSGWDTSSIITFKRAFNNCFLLTSVDTSNWDTSSVTTFEEAFNNCYLLTSIDTSSWDTSNVITFEEAFEDCSSLTSIDTSSWNTSNVTTFKETFHDCSSLTTIIGIGALDITALTDANYMFHNATLTTSSYDALLIGWEGQVENPNVLFDGGGSKYSAGAATTARATLVANGWIITDGGQV